MRLTSIALVALLISIAAYAYATNPAGCKELITDGLSLFISVSPVHVTSGGGTPIADLTRNELVSADGSAFSFPETTPPTPIQYYAIYFGAQMNAPSRAFTPVLVDWYKKFKPTHRNFEVIYLSSDPDKASMLAYMKDAAMPWPAFRFEDLKHDHQGIDKFSGSDIPDLVLVDSDGKVLSDTFNWSGANLGPQHVLEDIEKIVKKSLPPPPPPPVQPAGTFNTSLPPIKFWAPPNPIPAQPNWTWTTSDGTIYQNVVVTGIEADTVAITHSLGVGHIPIANLPADIKKQLNYDLEAAECANHTPFSLALLHDAQATARQLHRPLAWVATPPDFASNPKPDPDSAADLAQMAVNHIKPEAIIILVDDPTKLDSLPPAVRDQFYILDDGPMPPNHHFALPKIVFSTPDGAQTYGRVSFTLLKANREKSIDAALSASAAKALASAAEAAATLPAPAPARPPPGPMKTWAPPDVFPAQPNWIWTTSDGRTYQNVVVTKIEPEMVSITHSMGVAHVPIANLPPDIQKKLNYDPVAAAAAHAESDREEAHPYYRFASLAEAQGVARQLHWPLAWVCSFLHSVSAANPPADSGDDLTQMALNHLKSRAIVIFLDGDDDLSAVSPMIRDQQFFQLDDGPIPGGHHFFAPKIVFSDPDVTKAFGRVSFTQMKADREAAIDEVLATIPPDAGVPSPPDGQATNAPSTIPAPAPAPSPAPAPTPPPTVPTPAPPQAPSPTPVSAPPATNAVPPAPAAAANPSTGQIKP